MSRTLAILFWLIAAITALLFTVEKWGLPRAVSAHAEAIDRQFHLTMVIAGAAFLLVHLLLGIAVWRSRRARAPMPAFFEAVWTALTAAVFLFLAVTGQRVWGQLQLNRPPANALPIEVTAQQFVWNFRYAGADGRFGRTDPKLYDDADNSIGARPGPLGLEPKDPAGRDDVVSSLLVVPLGQPIALTLRAKDVTHDFYVPALRLKQDAVPGLRIVIHFTATRPGRYEIACAELCGQLHHQMRAYLEVKSPDEFATWLQLRGRNL
jgi:cytochrome c oxidase subunit II